MHILLKFALIIALITTVPSVVWGQTTNAVNAPAGVYMGVVSMTVPDASHELLVFLEVPYTRTDGPITVRLFVTETEPTLRLIVPSQATAANCLPPGDQMALHGPVPVEGTLMADGTLNVTYTWNACPQCFAAECRPAWFATLHLSAVTAENGVAVDLYTEVNGSTNPPNVDESMPLIAASGVLSPQRVDAADPLVQCDHTGACTLTDSGALTTPLGQQYAGLITLDDGESDVWLWLDISPLIAVETVPMRLFAIQLAPQPDLIAPSGIEADTCPPQAGIIDYPPALVDGKFAADGSFTTEYVWWVCPSCVECFVNFSETLQISAVPDGDGWQVEAAVIRYMQERPDDAEKIYQGSGHLSPVEPGLPDPVYRCDADGLCRFDFPLAE